MTITTNGIEYTEEQLESAGNVSTVKIQDSELDTGQGYWFFFCQSVGGTGAVHCESFIYDYSATWRTNKMRRRTSTCYHASGIIFSANYTPGGWQLYFGPTI